MYSQVDSIFPTPLYMFNRGIGILESESGEFREVIGGGLCSNRYNSTTSNNRVFDSNFSDILEFCNTAIG